MNDKEAVTALKPMYRKDPPVVFDIPARITNSSMSNKPEHSYTGPRWNVRDGADAHEGVASVGTPC